MNTNMDTLKIYERLKGAGLDEKAAKEIAEVVKDAIDDRVVTRKDLDDALTVAKAEITADIIKWVAAMLVAQAAVIGAFIRLFSH
ncbi:MAG: DUF1640 domain-containing protein [Nitrospirae bacterium]|nr:DUF1640 domain-containing protein [Nitrospirota bacterium]